MKVKIIGIFISTLMIACFFTGIVNADSIKNSLAEKHQYLEWTPPYEYEYSWKFAVGGGTNAANVEVNKNTGINYLWTYHLGDSVYGWAAAGIKLWNKFTTTSDFDSIVSMSGHLKGTLSGSLESSSMIWGWIQIYEGDPEEGEEPLVEKKIFEYYSYSRYFESDFEGSVSFYFNAGTYSIVFDASAGSDGFSGEAEANFWDDNYVRLDSIKLTSSAPDIELSPDYYDFGTVTVGEWKTKTFNLKNNGGSNATGKVGITGSGSYSIDSGGGNFELESGQSKEIIVRFTPSTSGTLYCKLYAKGDYPCNIDTSDISGTGKRIKSTKNLLQNFLQNHPNLFPIVKQLLGLR